MKRKRRKTRTEKVHCDSPESAGVMLGKGTTLCAICAQPIVSDGLLHIIPDTTERVFFVACGPCGECADSDQDFVGNGFSPEDAAWLLKRVRGIPKDCGLAVGRKVDGTTSGYFHLSDMTEYFRGVREAMTAPLNLQ